MSEQATIDAMIQFGGSFVQQLARLYQLADPGNQQRLEMAFQDYFNRYEQLAARRAAMARQKAEA